MHDVKSMPVPGVQQQGAYLVFWWKEFALGHLFIAPGEAQIEAEFYKKVTAAIAPALAFYTSTSEQERPGIAGMQFEAWKEWMETAFARWQTETVPEAVPVSVVICTRNRAVQLSRCLQLLMQSDCIPAEIVVVDNAPADDSTQEVVRQLENVRYVPEPRAGLDIARNTGVLHARFPLVAFIDDDVVVHPLWVYQVWQAFEDPEVAAITGLVLASALETEAQLIFEKHWSFNRGYTDKQYDANFFNATLAQGPPVWRIGAGANMAFRRSIFERTGLFNELLDAGAAGCNGDSEMWYRILAEGGKILYTPRAIVFHEHRRDMAGLKKQIYSYMRGHAAAALMQQQQHPQARYRKHLVNIFLINYSRAIIKGFPAYRFQYRTLWNQILGVFSGIAFYYRHRNKANRTTAKTYAHSAG
ncbi:hypothetical protein GCM10007389_05340 [Pontibacter akesuensis]|nr:hypothetical protein GCM10007389_05340 [Pontibacter akesuensis]